MHRNIHCPIHRAANEQQTDVPNICQPFDICNLLLCRALLYCRCCPTAAISTLHITIFFFKDKFLLNLINLIYFRAMVFVARGNLCFKYEFIQSLLLTLSFLYTSRGYSIRTSSTGSPLSQKSTPHRTCLEVLTEHHSAYTKSLWVKTIHILAL